MRRPPLASVLAALCVATVFTGRFAAAQSLYTWSGTSGALWSTGATNWLGGSGTLWDSTAGPSSVAVVTASGSASVSGTVYANGLNFASGSGTFSVGGGTLEFAGTNPTITTTATNQVFAISAPLSGSNGLRIIGSGSTILSGNNTALTGTYTIGTGTVANGSGVVLVSNANALAGATAVSLVATAAGNGNRGQLLQLGNGVTITGKALTVSSQTSTNRGSLYVASGGTATWDGNITMGGVQTYLSTDGTLTIGTGTSTTVGSAATNFVIRGSGTGTINSTLTAPFQKTDTGTWIITSTNNSFSGQINVFSGVLSIASIANTGINSSLGSGGTLVLGSGNSIGTLQFTGAQGGSTNRSIQLVGGTTTSGGFIENTVVGGTLTLTASVTTTDANPAVLRLGGAGDGRFTGSITNSATVSLTKLGSGSWLISGSNAYIGATLVSEGRLQIGAAGRINNSSGITVDGTTAEFRYNSGTALTQPLTLTRGTLSGTGMINTGVAIGSNVTLSPGNSPGTQTYASGTFGSGGSYTWEINNWASGTAGVNFDQAIFTNGLAVTSSTASRFTVNLTSLKADNTAGAVPNFNSGLSGLSFTIATGTMTGFSPSVFTLGTTSFLAANTVSGSANGGFWLSTNSGSDQLILTYAPSARYTLSATPAAVAIYAGGTTTITGSITNSTADRTGADAMQFSGLAVGTGSLSVTSGTVTAGTGIAGTVNFTSGSTGSFTFAPTVSATNVNLGTAALAGTITSGTVTVWNPAAVNSITSAVSLGNVRVSGTFGSSALTITNTAASGSFTEVLGATGATSGLASVTGSVATLAGGSTSTAISVGLGGSANTGSAGLKSGTATISFTSTGGPGTASIAAQTVAVSGTVFNPASAGALSGTVTLANNVRLNQSFGTQAVSISNAGTAAAAYQEGLAASVTGTSGGASGSGSFGNLFTGSSSTAISVGLGNASTATAGLKSGTVTIGFTSTGTTSGGATGLSPLALAAQDIVVNGGVYDYANATYTGTTLAFGVVHQGASVPSQTVAIGNQTVTNASYQDLLNVSGSSSNSAVTVTGFNNLGASTNGATTSNLTVGVSTATAGSLAGTVNLSLVSNANGVSGLSNGAATIVGSPGSITTTGAVFSGTATWNVAGGGSWGALASGTNWTSAGGVQAAPGTFAGYVNTDSAIFAGSQTGTSTILLDGATPSLAALVFSNTTGRYVLDQGSGGSLTLAAASGKPTIDVAAGALHEIKMAILGSNGLNKLGAGTLVLSGSSGFTGGTDVTAGKLAVNGFVGGAVNVASAAVLAGSGTLGGPVSVLEGGILAPGNSPGTLTMASGLSLADASILNFELNATNFAVGGGINDLVAVTGDLTLDGVLTVAAIGGGDFTGVANGSTWTLLTYSGALTNNGLSFGSMPTLGGDRYYAIDTSTSGVVNLVVVPEPRAILLAVCGIAGVAAWSRRRRRRPTETSP